MSPLNKTEKRHVLISGGSRGLGGVLVEDMLSAGYQVSTFSRKSTDFVEKLRENASFYYENVDIAESSQLNRFVEASEERFGIPYGLVNCAGVAIDGVLAAMREDQIASLLAINLGGTLLLSRLVSRRMLLRHGGGSIIMITSIIGIRGYSGLSVYGATKGGLDAAMRALARELGSRNIRVNSVAPGYLETEMSEGLSGSQRDQIVRRTPMNRLGTPEDVVGPVLFLLSDDSNFVTGQVLTVDGGITA